MDIPLAAKFRQSKIAYFTIATLYARAKQQPNSKRQLLILTWLNHSKNWIHTHTRNDYATRNRFFTFLFEKNVQQLFSKRDCHQFFGMKWVFSVVHLVPAVCIYIYFASKNWFFPPMWSHFIFVWIKMNMMMIKRERSLNTQNSISHHHHLYYIMCIRATAEDLCDDDKSNSSREEKNKKTSLHRPQMSCDITFYFLHRFFFNFMLLFVLCRGLCFAVRRTCGLKENWW